MIDTNPEETIPSIEWTRPKLRRFRKAFAIAFLEKQNGVGKDTFMFDGHEFLITFAGYLIAHLEDKLGMKKK